MVQRIPPPVQAGEFFILRLEIFRAISGEMVYDVVSCSIRSLLNPELTASWEKGLTYVAEGTITPEEYMEKLEHFIRRHAQAVMNLNNQYALRSFYDAAANNYKGAK